MAKYNHDEIMGAVGSDLYHKWEMGAAREFETQSRIANDKDSFIGTSYTQFVKGYIGRQFAKFQREVAEANALEREASDLELSLSD